MLAGFPREQEVAVVARRDLDRVELGDRRDRVERVGGVENPEFEQLTRIIPFIQCMADVQAFVALKTDQIGGERGGRSRSKRRLTYTCFSLEKQRPLEAKREKQRDRKTAIGHIMLVG